MPMKFFLIQKRRKLYDQFGEEGLKDANGMRVKNGFDGGIHETNASKTEQLRLLR